MTIDTARLDAKKRLVRRLHATVWTDGDLGAVDELVAADYVEHNPAMPGEVRGREAYTARVSAVRSAFAGFEVVPEDVIAEGDIVVVRHTGRGTHVGEFSGVPPTGNAFEVPGVAVHRIADGQIAEAWVNLDALGLLHQLDVVTPPWREE
jgi:steroid delta-isomerase-like uncharacterized protein